MTSTLDSLDIDQVISLLAQWNLDQILGDGFRKQGIDGGCLVGAEDGDIDTSDFPKAKKLHWKKFWRNLGRAQTHGVVLQTNPAPAPAPSAALPPVTPASGVVSQSVKFVGGYAQMDSTKHQKFISPVCGVLRVPKADLPTALAKIKELCGALQQKYPADFASLDMFVQTSVAFVNHNWHKLQPKYGTRGMTKEQAAFINFYTHESPFYPVFNKLLRDERRTLLIPYMWFFKSFLSACYCLPLTPQTVHRGVKANLKDVYEVGKTVAWWAITSTTNQIGVLQSPQFLGTKGDRTMFVITARSLVAIKDFTDMPEEEIILLPGTILEVTSVLDAGGGLTMIQMKEKEPFSPRLDFVHPQLATSCVPAVPRPPAPDGAGVPSTTQPRPYSTEWPRVFRDERDRIIAGLPTHVRSFLDVVTVEHIGSTAVPGLAAKPYVDIAVNIKANKQILSQGPPLQTFKKGMMCKLGYNRSSNSGQWYVRHTGAGKYAATAGYIVHLLPHTWDEGDPLLGHGVRAFKRAVRFRDYLRGHPDDCAAYAREKARASDQAGTSFARYTIGKRAKMSEIMLKAQGVDLALLPRGKETGKSYNFWQSTDGQYHGKSLAGSSKDHGAWHEDGPCHWLQDAVSLALATDNPDLAASLLSETASLHVADALTWYDTYGQNEFELALFRGRIEHVMLLLEHVDPASELPITTMDTFGLYKKELHYHADVPATYERNLSKLLFPGPYLYQVVCPGGGPQGLDRVALIVRLLHGMPAVRRLLELGFRVRGPELLRHSLEKDDTAFSSLLRDVAAKAKE